MNMEFSRFKILVDKYYKNDCRELNFQNRILIPFLESLICEKYEVVDSSHLYKNWKNINRETFAGQYTPDVLVVEEWDLFKEDKQSPLVITGVKRPTADDRKHAENEVKEYLEKAEYVILTDCITWEIYQKNIETVYFYLDKDENGVCKQSATIMRKERRVNWIDDTISGNDWEKLNNKIIDIINGL